MEKIEQKRLIETCPIHPLEFFTECVEVGVEVKIRDESGRVRFWVCS